MSRATVTEVAMRSRFHPADWNEVVGVVQLAVAENTLAEVRLRVMDEHGRVIRVRLWRAFGAYTAGAAARTGVDTAPRHQIGVPWGRRGLAGVGVGCTSGADSEYVPEASRLRVRPAGRPGRPEGW
ncbi:hypothetical protein [Streptomyces sp. NBC_00365]|uniref:hypothetical protein n=1 Tax=Streptomyces sp. NBC_00365 TaxID=2975726 RepID=UPI00225ACE07|nr:hypothetical protein [Streptomyces sp. NBC_00365]